MLVAPQGPPERRLLSGAAGEGAVTETVNGHNGPAVPGPEAETRRAGRAPFGTGSSSAPAPSGLSPRLALRHRPAPPTAGAARTGARPLGTAQGSLPPHVSERPRGTKQGPPTRGKRRLRLTPPGRGSSEGLGADLSLSERGHPAASVPLGRRRLPARERQPGRRPRGPLNPLRRGRRQDYISQGAARAAQQRRRGAGLRRLTSQRSQPRPPVWRCAAQLSAWGAWACARCSHLRRAGPRPCPRPLTEGPTGRRGEEPLSLLGSGPGARTGALPVLRWRGLRAPGPGDVGAGGLGAAADHGQVRGMRGETGPVGAAGLAPGAAGRSAAVRGLVSLPASATKSVALNTSLDPPMSPLLVCETVVTRPRSPLGCCEAQEYLIRETGTSVQDLVSDQPHGWGRLRCASEG